MAESNFKVFNESMLAANTFNDSEYDTATQRQSGVIPGIAISRMHNKLYRQTSVMAAAIASYIVSNANIDCLDTDVTAITAGLKSAVEKIITAGLYAVDDTHTPTLDEDTLENLLSGLANQVKNITGESTWMDLPGSDIVSILSLLGQGGIVAARFESNGFVKFANGFCIQWGMQVSVSSSENMTIALPLAYANSSYRVFPAAVHLTNNLSAYIRTQANTNFVVYYPGAGVGVGWVAVGTVN